MLTHLHVQGGRQRQQPQQQQQINQYEEAGRPRVWVPGQGWVAIDPDWEQQGDAAPLAEQNSQQTQHRGGQEEAKAGPSQIRTQGHEADSRREGTSVRGLASDDTGGVKAAESQRSEVANDLQEAQAGDAGSSDAVMAREGYATGEEHKASKPQKQRQAESDEQASADQSDEQASAEQSKQGQTGMQEEQADHQDQADTGLEDGQQTGSSIPQHDSGPSEGQADSSKQALQEAKQHPGYERQSRHKVINAADAWDVSSSPC